MTINWKIKKSGSLYIKTEDPTKSQLLSNSLKTFILIFWLLSKEDEGVSGPETPSLGKWWLWLTSSPTRLLRARSQGLRHWARDKHACILTRTMLPSPL